MSLYEAEQISLKRRVALKVLPFAAGLESRRLERFKIEAQAAACLSHRNIVPVYSIETDKDMHFYTMQFVEGRPLSEVVRLLRVRSGLAVRDKIVVPPLGAMQQHEQTSLTIGEATRTEPIASHTVVSATDTHDVTEGPMSGSLWNEESCRTSTYLRAIATLGIQAAEALDHAHESRIVHRDIKPHPR